MPKGRGLVLRNATSKTTQLTAAQTAQGRDSIQIIRAIKSYRGLVGANTLITT